MALLIVSCSEIKNNEMQKIYDHRKEMQSVFKDITIIRSRDRERRSLTLKVIKDTLANTYFMEKVDGVYRYKCDSIEFFPDNYVKSSDGKIDNQHVDMIERDVNMLVKKLEEFKIQDVSSNIDLLGVTLKLYLENNSVMLYIPDKSALDSNELVKYIESLEKIDNEWYYSYKE